MPMLEGQVDAVIGVDTHRDRHAAALLDPNGGGAGIGRPPSVRFRRIVRGRSPGSATVPYGPGS